MSPKDRPAPPRPLAASTAERLAVIVEAAEQAASKVIDDAEAQARHRLEEAQAEADRLLARRLAPLSGLTDSLVAQAEAIRQQSERLLASLEDARGQIQAEGSDRRRSPIEDFGEIDPEEPPRGTHLTAVAPVEELAEERPPTEPRPPASRDASAGARLLATQMAVSGNSREEIETRLRNGFEIEDTAPILDAILGPED
jgi:cell division septum initiation protein DivIVA